MHNSSSNFSSTVFFSNGNEDQPESTEQPPESPPKRRGRPPRNPAPETNEKEVERYVAALELCQLKTKRSWSHANKWWFFFANSSAAEEELEVEVKTRKRNKEDEKDTNVVTPARKSARLAKPNWS